MKNEETKDQVTVNEEVIKMMEQRASLTRFYREEIKFLKTEVEFLELSARKEKAKADRIESLAKQAYYAGQLNDEPKKQEPQSEEPKEGEPLKEGENKPDNSDNNNQ